MMVIAAIIKAHPISKTSLRFLPLMYDSLSLKPSEHNELRIFFYGKYTYALENDESIKAGNGEGD
jgi:hypothetical protein